MKNIKNSMKILYTLLVFVLFTAISVSTVNADPEWNPNISYDIPVYAGESKTIDLSNYINQFKDLNTPEFEIEVTSFDSELDECRIEHSILPILYVKANTTAGGKTASCTISINEINTTLVIPTIISSDLQEFKFTIIEQVYSLEGEQTGSVELVRTIKTMSKVNLTLKNTCNMD